MHDQWCSAAGAPFRHLYHVYQSLPTYISKEQAVSACKSSGIYKSATATLSINDEFNA